MDPYTSQYFTWVAFYLVIGWIDHSRIVFRSGLLCLDSSWPLPPVFQPRCYVSPILLAKEELSPKSRDFIFRSGGNLPDISQALSRQGITVNSLPLHKSICSVRSGAPDYENVYARCCAKKRRDFPRPETTQLPYPWFGTEMRVCDLIRVFLVPSHANRSSFSLHNRAKGPQRAPASPDSSLFLCVTSLTCLLNVSYV